MAMLGVIILALCTSLLAGILNNQLRDIEERVGKIEEQLKEKAKQ